MALLSTKLYIPAARQRQVRRARLMARLSEGLARPLILVSAPAGFGKSALVSAWLVENQADVDASWYALDAGDNDAQVFLAYLAAMLGRLQEGLGLDGATALAVNPPPPTHAVLGLLLHDLARLERPAVLILDDYHQITNPEIHDAVAYLLANLPPQAHLFLLTRADPPLPLARLRVSDRLVEIRSADLLFELAEARAFLFDTMSLDLPAAQSQPVTQVLMDRTEGWAAGLQMAALALKRFSGQAGSSRQLETFVSSFTGRSQHVLDYLIEEVISSQSPAIQSFLLDTSVLEELSGPLCDALTERTGCARLLVHLDRANLFLVPLDDTQTWYRYHHLFAEGLLEHLRLEDPGRVPELHRRAARWYASEGRHEQAIRHALAGEDYGEAARLLDEIAFPFLRSGRVAPVVHIFKLLPPAEAQARPRLALAWAYSLVMTGQFAAALAALVELEPVLQKMGPEGQGMLGELYGLRASALSMGGDAAGTIANAELALELLLPGDTPQRAVVTLNQGNAFMLAGDYVASDRAHGEAARCGFAAENLNIAFVGLSNQAEARMIRGDLNGAEQPLQYGLQMIRERLGNQVWRAPSASLIYAGLGELAIERNQVEEARAFIAQAISLAEQSGYVVAQVSAYAGQAHFELSLGSPEDALQWIERAVRVVSGPLSVGLLSPMQTLQARIQVAQGLLERVEQWAARAEIENVELFDYLSEPQALVWLRLYRARGQSEPGIQLAERMLAQAVPGGREGRALEIRIQQALLYRLAGKHARALDALLPALETGSRQGYQRLFLDEGEPLRTLLLAFLRRLSPDHPLRPYVRHLLEAFQSASPELTQSDEPAQNPGPVLVEPLSRREIEVLRLLAKGLSNPEIASQLVLSPSTVKAHLHHIQGKLGTRSRLETVQRARGLGII